MQQISDSQREQVFHGEKIEHSPVDPGFQEGVFVLRQADIVQPPNDPLVIEATWQIFASGGILLGLKSQKDFLSGDKKK